MALVLCTGVNKTLLQTRRLILEREGHTVVTVRDEKKLTASCQKHSFNIAVIGQTVNPNMKLRIASLVRQHCSGAKILELYPLYAEKVLKDADSWLAVPIDVPQELAARVNELANMD
jgi:CheY-like chemotaxis protein